jgi:hypothetical protein
MRWISNSTKALLRKVSTSILPALLGVGAIYLILSNGFTRKTIESSKIPSDFHAAPLVKDPQGASSDNDRMNAASEPASKDPHEPTLAKNSAQAQTPAPVSTPAFTPAPALKGFATDSEFLATQQPAAVAQQSSPPTQSTFAAQQPANDPNKSEGQPGEIKRKSLERKRLAAERNRARLEKMYQKHRISSDAYKKGEEKYKSEIEEYRSAVNAGKAPKSDS